MAPPADPTDLSELHLQMDALAMRSLELTQEFLTAKAQLERCTREGNLLLAKARCGSSTGLGACAVGRHQLPDPNSDAVDVAANVRLSAQDCAGDGGIRFRYLSLDRRTSKKQETVKPTQSGDDDPSSSILSHRKTVESADPNAAVVGHDPLRWFGVLVPNSLRQAQTAYQRAIEYSVDAANAKNELLGVENRMKFLKRMLEKMHG